MTSDRAHLSQLDIRTDNLDLKIKKVNLRPLKVFAVEKLPDSSLRDVILSEVRDEVDVAAFLTVLPIYLRLSRRIAL